MSGKHLLRIVPLLCSLLAVACPSVLRAQESSDYRLQLIEEARSRQLWEEPVWLRLLHYEPGMLFPWVVRSVADDPSFFEAPNGAADPQAELEATISSFFEPAQDYDREKDINPHAQCRFAARFHWLSQQLHVDRSRLPNIDCLRLEEWLDSLNPKAIALIFPSSYVNNPASAFGHTLLRVDGEGQDENSRLLSYSVNYAANTGDDGGLIFMFKGVVGGYPGVFSVSPYYKKINEYNDVEDRDVWEYELDFTPEEIRQILRHVWELRYTYFDYYFFDENCSYHLLSLFEVVRPELRLTNEFRAYKFSGWVIPPDTVRVVTQHQELVKKVTYRPALSTQLRAWDSVASSEDKELSKAVAEGEIDLADLDLESWSEERRAEFYELSFDYLNYRRVAIENEEFDSAGLGRKLLRERSKLSVARVKPDVPQPKVRPDTGHRSRRASIRGGYDDGDWFYELHIRPAFHDLLDPRGGYSRGSQIDFFDTAVRGREDKDIELWYFVPVNIVSLAPRSTFVRPTSWNLETAVRRKRFAPEYDKLIGRIAGGPGLAYEFDSSVLYGFAETAVEYSDEYSDNVNAGLGPHAGFLYDLGEPVRLFTEFKSEYFFFNESHWDVRAAAGISVTLSKRFAVRADVSRKHQLEHYWTEAGAMLSFYF
ncbi:MAG: DUF4105 domain-containing protein [Bdellovibrionales bacterium]|nr:DUF4105 domain-containing protein [Bdellovibrionales bacterium]